MLLLGVVVQPMSSTQDVDVLAAVALRWGDVLDAAMAVLHVVPVHELAGPLTGGGQIGEAFGRELRAVLGCLEQ